MALPCTAFISPGGGELIMIMLVLIMLFGAKDAPRILRNIQKFLDKMQRTAADFRYKMMYGDLHSGTTTEKPYDVEADYADEEVSDPGFEPVSAAEKSAPEKTEANPAEREARP